MKNSILFAIVLIVSALQLSAQRPDTLYIYDTETIIDTLVVRDTTFIHDTVFLHKTAAPKDTQKVSISAYRPDYQEDEEIAEDEDVEQKEQKDKAKMRPKKERAKPQWLYDDLYQHEIKLEICDPYMLALFDRYFVYVYPRGMSPAEYRDNNLLGFQSHISPLFALSTHFRVNKWFWVGVMVGYAHIDDIESRRPLMDYSVYNGAEPPETNMGPICIRRYNAFLLMPELRFSYLNREHVTLYSGLSIGITKFYGRSTIINIEEEGPIHPYFTSDENRSSSPTLFASAHITLFGAKFGWNHWFASVELGAGFKGFGTIGIGYEF